jgi:hypothetical protein
MNVYFKIILESLGWAILFLILINFIHFAISLVFLDDSLDQWNFLFSEGQFYINGAAKGYSFSSPKAWGLIALAFVYFLFRSLRKLKRESQ